MSESEKMFKCTRCSGRNTIWIGYRYNKSSKKRVRRCKSCGTKFTPGNVFPRARFERAHVIEAAGLYHGGLSLDKVKSHMWLHRNIKISRTSILHWARKYSRLVKDFASKLKLVIRSVGHCDDVYIDVEGDELYYWGAMDSKILFKINSRFSG